jgi:uncharacterized membrane protein
MTTLTVLVFPSAEGVHRILDTLLDLQNQHLIQVQDAAFVTWPRGAKQAKSDLLGAFSGAHALSGQFWGMLFGLLFFVPYFGPDLDAAADTLRRKFGDCGIDARFMTRIRVQVVEGTSALFVLTSGPIESKVVAAMQDQSFELIAANLPKAKEDELREVFGAGVPPRLDQQMRKGETHK